MGFFPTDAIDEDEVGPSANGSYFKYVAVDDKWILIPNADVYTQSEVDAFKLNKWAAPDGDISMGTFKITNVVDPIGDQDASTKKYHNDNKTVAGDLSHNSLANLNDGDTYEHISQDQKNALHTRLHVMGGTSDHQSTTTWTIFYANGSNDIIELPIGADTKVLKSNGPTAIPSWEDDNTGGAGGDTDAIHDNVADEITAITPKTTLVDADEFIIEDSEASFIKKAVTLGNLKSAVAQYAIGCIIMFSGSWTDNSTMAGWYKCDGNNGTVNLVDKFVRGALTSGGSGGSDDAVIVEHEHNRRFWWGSGTSKKPNEFDVGNNFTDFDNETVGESGTGKNIPAFYALIFIQRIS